MKFVAEDGKTFDTMEECEEYEKKLGVNEMDQAAAILDEYVIMVNCLGKVMKPETNYKENCEKFLAEFENLLISESIKGVKYVIIHHSNDVFSDKKIIDALEWFSDYAEICLPLKPGVWRWTADGEWIEYGDDYLEFQRNWEKVESYLM